MKSNNGSYLAGLNRGLAQMFALGILAMATSLAAAQTFTDLHDFSGSDPQQFSAPGTIPQGRDGNLYGMSEFGGTSGIGTVYSITTAGTPTIIQSFNGSQGSYPFGGLTLGTDGQLYGVTSNGGSSSYGVLFKITTSGTLTVMHTFTNTGDGAEPAFPPVLGNDGNYYGITDGYPGGVQVSGSTFYKLTSSGTFSTLHTFTNTEGSLCGAIILGSDGNFYGACDYNGGNSGFGTLYKVTTGGKVTVLHTFSGTDGTFASNHFLAQANDGNYYGTAYGSGTNGYGVIFQLKPSGTYKVLYNFTDGSDGANPIGGLTLGADGDLYGTTNSGANATCNSGFGIGCGVIFKITTGGTYSVLHSFDATQGGNPQSNLTLRTDGVLYGNTISGGQFGLGVFYSLNVGFSQFASLVSTSGKVASKVGILGQGFTTSSVVKFNGVKATTISLTGTTFINATVPTGALTGAVTVTTGSTVLTTPQTFKVTPKLTSFTPSSGAAGTVVTITGTGLTQTTKVTFNGTSASFTVNSDSQVSATAPTGVTTGPIKITTSGGSVTSTTNFSVTPTITSFTPTSGAAGTVVTITGTGLTQATSVTFNGTTASFTVNSDSQVSATAPAGVTTGPIKITTSGGSATSSTNFSVTPTITSFSPTSGPVGTVVTINGTGLTQTTKVTFNGKSATFTVNSDSKVTATVPTGATTGKIKVTTNGGTVTSATNFTVT